MRTGKSAWTYEEAVGHQTSNDLAEFLVSGTSKPSEHMTKKKKKKKKKAAEENKNEKPEDREDDTFGGTRARIFQWNSEGVGGYTADLHAKYQRYSKNKRQKMDVSLSP